MTLWTIRLALVLFAASVLARILHRDRQSTMLWARALWTIATLLYVAHVLFAFHEYHDWSHAAAVAHTAEQSEQLIGIRLGAGIWFNHLFTLLCVTETAWWWARPAGYQARRVWLNVAVFGYLLFIAINGAIVFANGPVRWVSVLGVVIIFSVLLLRQRTRQQGGPPSFAQP